MRSVRAPRRVLIILVVLTLLIGSAILFGPPLLLRVLNFVPRGEVDTYWTQLEQQASVAPQPLPAILSTRRPTLVAALPTDTRQPGTATFTAAPTLTATPVRVTASPTAATPDQATPLPSDTPTLTPTDPPTPTPTNPYADYFSVAFEPDSVRVLARGYLNLSLQGSKTFANALWVGRDTNDQPFGVAEFDESAIPALCQQYFKNCVSSHFRVDQVDFRPGGMMVYGSVNVLGLYWQPVGVALLLDSTRTHLKLAGMVWNGEVYEMPTTGPLASTLKDLANRGNAALDHLNIYASGYDLTVAELYFDDTRLMVVLKNAPAS